MTLLKLSHTQGIHSFRYVQGTEVLSLDNTQVERFSQNKIQDDLLCVRAYTFVKTSVIIMQK